MATTLPNEIATGPLSAEISQFAASGNDGAIYAAFHRKDIPVYSKVKVGVFADWLAITGLRALVEDHSTNITSPLRSNALSILDLLRGSHDYLIDFGEPSKQALLQAWVANGGITAQQQSDFLAKTIKYISRADQLPELTISIETIAKALRG